MGIMDTFSVFAPLLGAGAQQYQADQANRANRETQADTLNYLDSVYGNINNDLLSSIGSYGNSLDANIWGNRRAGGGSLADVSAGLANGTITDQGGAMDAFAGKEVPGTSYYDRLKTGLEMVDQLGGSEREQLNRQWESRFGEAEKNLTDRGLAGSTIMPAVSANIQEGKDRSTRALEEDIVRRKLGVYSDLSGDFLNALDNAAREKFGTGLNWVNNLNQQTSQNVGLRTGYPVEGPPPPNWGDVGGTIANNIAAQRAAQEARDAANNNDWIGPTITQGAFNLGSVGLYGSFLKPTNPTYGGQLYYPKSA